MTQTKAGKLAGREQLLAGYREADVSIDGADETFRIRYKAPSAKSMLRMQELGKAAEEAENDSEKARQSWDRLAGLVADHLVDEEGGRLCEAEELLDAPMDTLLALVRAITPTVEGGKSEVEAQGEG